MLIVIMMLIMLLMMIIGHPILLVIVVMVVVVVAVVAVVVVLRRLNSLHNLARRDQRLRFHRPQIGWMLCLRIVAIPFVSEYGDTGNDGICTHSLLMAVEKA